MSFKLVPFKYLSLISITILRLSFVVKFERAFESSFNEKS